MKIIPLTEGAFTVDQTKKFISFEPGKDDLQARNKGSILVEIQPFVVITSNDIIVLDTGLGFTNVDGQLQIHTNLTAHGINSTDVTKVLLSHLHKDHSGGIASPGKKELSFKNADYYVNKQEWNFALEKGFPSYHIDDFLCLKENPQVHFTDDKGSINEYIKYEVTGAHTPFHQVFWIEENNEKIFFGGDVAPQLQQMKNRFKAKYDYDGARAMELRKDWWETGQREKWTFLFYHDIKVPTYRF
ncbi:MAG: MBL fold metallo-hydrolase [Bacteroidota bacterium]|nr:MBL fold metallo-hydrolase [Bacteroidota bacterium]